MILLMIALAIALVTGAGLLIDWLIVHYYRGPK